MNIGIIGAGGIAAAHALGINHLPDEVFRLRASCDTDFAKAAAFCEKYGGEPVGRADELLADPEVDAVIVALPHGLHASVGIQALRAGKHVLVEKPMAPTVAECRELIAAAAETGRTLQVGHEFYLYPCIRKAREILQSGELGRPLLMRGELCSYIYNRLDTWWMDFEKARGGPAINMGVHQFDTASFLAGRPPRRARGEFRQLDSRAAPGIEDYFRMELDFGDGLTADCRLYSFLEKADFAKPNMTVLCERGWVSAWSNELLTQTGKEPVETRHRQDGSQAFMVFAEQMRQFHDFIVKGVRPRATGEFGLAAVACIEAAGRGGLGPWVDIA